MSVNPLTGVQFRNVHTVNASTSYQINKKSIPFLYSQFYFTMIKLRVISIFFVCFSQWICVNLYGENICVGDPRDWCQSFTISDSNETYL